MRTLVAVVILLAVGGIGIGVCVLTLRHDSGQTASASDPAPAAPPTVPPQAPPVASEHAPPADAAPAQPEPATVGPKAPPQAPAEPPPNALRCAIDGPVVLEGDPKVGVSSFQGEGEPLLAVVSVRLQAAATDHRYYLGMVDVHLDEAVTDAGEHVQLAVRCGPADSPLVPDHLITTIMLVPPVKPATRLSLRGDLALAPDGPLRAVRMRFSAQPVWTSIRDHDGLSVAAVRTDDGDQIILSPRLASLFAGASFSAYAMEPYAMFGLQPGTDGFAHVIRPADRENSATGVEVRFFDPARLVRCPFRLDNLPLPYLNLSSHIRTPAEPPAAAASAPSYRCSSIDLVD